MINCIQVFQKPQKHILANTTVIQNRCVRSHEPAILISRPALRNDYRARKTLYRGGNWSRRGDKLASQRFPLFDLFLFGFLLLRSHCRHGLVVRLFSYTLGHVVELPDGLVLVVGCQIVCGRVSRGLGRIALLVLDIPVDRILNLRILNRVLGVIHSVGSTRCIGRWEPGRSLIRR